ncbi:MAG: flagellar protein FlaG [Gammaproteobacteria bacterium]|nr:flagellar protein FlaG [Gammaproteobacteria bacterium]NNJ71728.1 flagellar protein FlaG [Enterobacterales bacterium]
MTTDINNLVSQGLKPELRQLNVPSGANVTEAIPSSRTNADNIVRVDFVNRQAVANGNQVGELAQKQKLSDEQKAALSDSVQTLSRSVQTIARSLEFRVDDNSGKTVITVRDSESKEVIRQIPSDQLLQLSARLQDMQEMRNADPKAAIAGILFTSKT